jgi:hypothetical protein
MQTKTGSVSNKTVDYASDRRKGIAYVSNVPVIELIGFYVDGSRKEILDKWF